MMKMILLFSVKLSNEYEYLFEELRIYSIYADLLDDFKILYQINTYINKIQSLGNYQLIDFLKRLQYGKYNLHTHLLMLILKAYIYFQFLHLLHSF